MRYKLPKSTKLCSNMAIERLFTRDSGEVSTTIAYPLRAVWRHDTQRHVGDPVQFLISIPKRKLRHAVDRVTMRRRVREAYRLLRVDYFSPGDTTTVDNIDIAFIYIADKLMPYHSVKNAMNRILQRISTDKKPITQC